MTNKIAVISDIHGNSLALEAVLADIEKNQIDTVLNLGDSLYGPMDPGGTFELLSGRDLISISGNQDRFIVENWKGDGDSNSTLSFVLEALPGEALVWLKDLNDQTSWKNIYMCHGNLKRDDAPLIEKFNNEKIIQKKSDELESELKNVQEDLVLCGHTHVPKIIQLSGSGKFVVNPGSVGLPAYDDELPIYHKMESGTPLAKYMIIELEESRVNSFSQRHIPYNHEKAAEQAEKNGRADWAAWIRTGMV